MLDCGRIILPPAIVLRFRPPLGSPSVFVTCVTKAQKARITLTCTEAKFWVKEEITPVDMESKTKAKVLIVLHPEKLPVVMPKFTGILPRQWIQKSLERMVS